MAEQIPGRWHGHTSGAVRKRYNDKTYDALNIRIAKGHRDRIKASADAAGMSMAEYICSAITAYGCPVSSRVSPDADPE